jgi:hypothetical protein
MRQYGRQRHSAVELPALRLVVEASTGGQGFVFDVNPTQKNFFAAWYTYTPNGQ